MNKVSDTCTKRCKSEHHGDIMTSAITKRAVTDEALASFIRGTCANFTQVCDYEGRTLLHMAVSRGRKSLMEWLVRHSSEASINVQDTESGFTPLHRSIFYGQIHIAVSLIKMGVNKDIVDKDDYKPLEHATLDRHYMYKHAGTQPCNVYVWGSNSNYTLGTGTQQQKKTPDVLNCFSRTNTSVKQICLGKFHSIWVCDEGAVWACGQLSRVGAGGGTILCPTSLRLPEPCLQAAVTLDSTIFLLQSGAIIQCSVNNTDNSVSQSKMKTPTMIKLPPVKPLMKLSQPIGVCASRVHAVVWNKHALYTWGTNLGQLGHSKPTDKYIEAPIRVQVALSVSVTNNNTTSLELAEASDAATVFTTSRGDVYLLHKHICKKIAIKQINLKQVCVDAKVTEQGAYSRVTVLMLTNVGELLIWQDTAYRHTRCVFGLNHQIEITNVTLTHDAIFFTTKYGEAFVGTVPQKINPTIPRTIKKQVKEKDNKSALVKFLEKDDCTAVKITKIHNIHRATIMAVDNEGINFACLQIKPTCGLKFLPKLSPTCISKHMMSLLETASDEDILHDVVFKVDQKLFPAHIFIIASGSDLLYKLYQEHKVINSEEKPTIVLDNVHPEVFDRILKYLYTGTCDVLQTGPCPLKIRREDLGIVPKKDNVDIDLDNPMEISAFEVYKNPNNKGKKQNKRQNICEEPVRTHIFCDPVKLVQAAAKRLQVMSLHKLLDKFFYKNGAVNVKETTTLPKTTPFVWKRESFLDLADTNVCTKDGILIPSHKCVLAARLEYFNGMFMHSWSESKTKSTVTLPVNPGTLIPIINFLYTDTCPDVTDSDNIDFICSILIVADQLFINKLRELCEVALANLITLKNCADLCQFAHIYNATQLKKCCMEFICLNLANFLENRSLEGLEDSVLEDISKYYCQFNYKMSSRIITPFSVAPDDEVVNEFHKLYPLDINLVDEELKSEIIEATKKKIKYSKNIEYTEREKARMRYESISSMNSLDLSNDNPGDITLSLSNISSVNEDKQDKKNNKWIEVPTAQQKQQKVVQARLKAIGNAKAILVESQPSSFTKLMKSESLVLNAPDNIISSPPQEYISSLGSLMVSSLQSPQGNITINRAGPKLSQKQRKKLAMQGDTTPQDFIEQFSDKFPGKAPEKKSPKSPWKVIEMPVSSSSSKKKSLEFNQILADQKKQKDDSSRIMTKSLNLTQLEDKAIEDLEKFYNVHNIDEEMITVRRIELQVSSPQWLHTNSK